MLLYFYVLRRNIVINFEPEQAEPLPEIGERQSLKIAFHNITIHMKLPIEIINRVNLYISLYRNYLTLNIYQKLFNEYSIIMLYIIDFSYCSML